MNARYHPDHLDTRDHATHLLPGNVVNCAKLGMQFSENRKEPPKTTPAIDRRCWLNR
jgi:hypothetical protein